MNSYLFIILFSYALHAEECARQDKNCPNSDPTPSPVAGQYPTQSTFELPMSFEDYFRRNPPKSLKTEINSFAEFFYPAIKRKGTPQMRTGIRTIDLKGIFQKLNRLPEDISDNELLAAILLHTGDRYNDPAEHLDRAHEALVATRASHIGATVGTNEALRYIALKMKGRSIGNKVGFLTSFLQRLNANYDESLPMGEVSPNLMFQEISNDIKGIGASRDAGVCRHMHLLAVKAARPWD